MNLFENILSEMYLLLEDADVTSVNNAITNLHPATIRYNDGEQDAKTGERKIYPVAYGISTAGNPVVRAYQPSGDSKRGVPNWKFFKLANISYWNTDESETFDPNQLVGFNKSGDDQMQTLYNIAPIGNGKQYTKKGDEQQMTAIKPGPITKKDIPGSKENERYTANNAIDDILGDVQSKNVDNNQNKEYTDIGDKVNAPKETAPISKNDLMVQDIPVQNKSAEEQKPKATNEPILKQDIENKPAEITTSYNDMLNRIDNLHKDDMEDKEEV